MPKLNKRIPLYKYNHPQCKCHCQTPKNRATGDIRKETHADNTEINTLLSHQSVAFLPEPPQLYAELCNDFSSELGGSLHILAAGTGRVPGMPWLDSGLTHSGHGWGSKAKLPSVSLRMLVYRQQGFNIRMQWAESKFDCSILSCAMCITSQLLAEKMFLILQIPSHLYG